MQFGRCTESYPAGAIKCQSIVEKTANALSVSNSEAMQVGSCHLIYLIINIPAPRHQMYVFCVYNCSRLYFG